MTSQEILDRARSAVGRKTKYRLGGGKIVPAGIDPRDEVGSCDCSAFVCWVLGIEKHQPNFSWLKAVNGGWYNTAGIYWDAVRETTGFFDVVNGDPRPGDVVVYPPKSISLALGVASSVRPQIGHVGIITRANPENTVIAVARIATVIHCSAGNFRGWGDAIRETNSEVFQKVGSSRVVRFAGLEF